MNVPWSGGDWRRVLVYGLATSGRAAASFLRERGVEVVGVDRRPADELDLGDLGADPGFEVMAGGEPEDLPAGIDGVVVSPGVPPDRPLLAAARRGGVPVIAEVELAFPFLEGPVIGITGTNGKSTTTALTGDLLRAAGFAVEVCGNIGAPICARVAGEPGRVFVTELSSFQLEAIDHFRPRAAALLNLAADHLDRYAVFADYAAAKRRLFRRQEKDDVAVLNADDPEVATVATVAAARPRLFSRRGPIADGCYLDGERVIEVDPGEGSRLLFTAADVPLAGVHNLENAMAAALLARAMGAAPEAMRGGLRGFHGLPHRVQRVAERRGVTWYDDSKGTNPAATVKSLEGFPDRSVHLILGGRNKGADPRELATVIGRKARWVYFVGEAGAEFAAAVGHLAPGEMAGTLDRAVEAAARRAVAGEAVLLSPACASFDQYTSYAERGDHFQRLVRELDRPRAARGG